MNWCIVQSKVVFEPGDGIDDYHSTMFHGLVDQHFPLDDNNLGDELIHPLHLRKNTYALGDILKPSRNLVLSDAVRKKLLRFGGLAFLPIVFSRLYKVEYHPGEWTQFPDDYDRFTEWVDRIKHDPGLAQQLPTYYELIVPRCSVEGASSAERLTSTFPSLTYNECVKLEAGKELLTKSWALWTPEGVMMKPEMFEVMDPHIEWPYFKMRRIEFNGQH